MLSPDQSNSEEQQKIMHDTKRRRLELERDFYHLNIEEQQRRERAALEKERLERFWQMEGEVDMGVGDDVEVIRPTSIESPPDSAKSKSKPLSRGVSWYEPEKDRQYILLNILCFRCF